MKKLCVIGLGYIGLPTALIAAQRGLQVTGFDIDPERIASINAGIAPLQEAELQHHLKQAIHTKQFTASSTIAAADYFIIAVPTPCTDKKTADLHAVWCAVESIISVIGPHNTIILESTVPVGTTQKIAEYIQKITGLLAGVDFFIAHCPERVLPSNIFHELRYNARLIGGVNNASTQKAIELYEHFVEAPLHKTNDTTAELVKLVENSYRDVNIAFAHQVAAMAEHLASDPYEVIELANKHPRVNILQPRCGVGGHCIAIDPWFLVETFPQQTELLACARRINDARPQIIIDRIKNFATSWQQHHHGKCKVLALGLAYKPDVEDVRESPALHIAQQCNQLPEIDLAVVDPYIVPEKMHENKFTNMSLADGVAWADCLVILVGHTYFKKHYALIGIHDTIFDFCGLVHGHHQKNNVTITAQGYAHAPSTP